MPSEPTNAKPKAAHSPEDELATLKAALAKTQALASRLANRLRKERPKKRGTYNKFPLRVDRKEPDPGPFRVDTIIPFDELKRRYGEWAIRKCGGDKPEAAKQLHIALRTLYNWFGEQPPAPAHVR